MSSPNVGDTYNLLLGVDCTNAGGTNQCTAVGYHQNTSGSDPNSHTFVLQGTETNGTWSFSTRLEPGSGDQQRPSGGELPHRHELHRDRSTRDGGGLAEQGTETNGTWTWSTLGTDSTGGALVDLDCTSATSCIAVGTQGFPDQTLVETWNGSGGFTPVTSPNPGAYASAFSDISCVSASNCTAVGNTTADNSSPSVPLVEQWDGANWWQVSGAELGQWLGCPERGALRRREQHVHGRGPGQRRCARRYRLRLRTPTEPHPERDPDWVGRRNRLGRLRRDLLSLHVRPLLSGGHGRHPDRHARIGLHIRGVERRRVLRHRYLPGDAELGHAVSAAFTATAAARARRRPPRSRPPPERPRPRLSGLVDANGLPTTAGSSTGSTSATGSRDSAAASSTSRRPPIRSARGRRRRR